MKLDKVKKSFNDYDLELSWGQLEVILAALERDHSEPVADEMLAELQWYMERVPGPGEEEEEVKAREEQGMAVPGEGGAEEAEGAEGMVPAPPTEGPADVGKGPEPPPEEMPGGEGGGMEAPPEEGANPAAEPPPEEEMPPGGPAPEEADRHLPAPPAE